MKIVFENEAKNVLEEYPISTISYYLEEGKPIDIFITGTLETLEAIAEYHAFGDGNIRELDWEDYFNNSSLKKEGSTHEALFARLDSFRIEGMSKVKLS